MLDRAKLKGLQLLPKNTVSRAVGAASEISLPKGLQGFVNSTFANLAGIDLSESERPPSDYRSVNAFFTRKLKDGARDIDAERVGDLVSPADGRVSHFGRITRDTLVQAKGRDYRLVDLVDSGADADRFREGHYITVYLSPRDYHRVHSPAGGAIERISYIPGHLFPVNPFAVENVDELFAVNERLITYVSNRDLGEVAVIMVGATCVGRMSLTFNDLVTNSKFRRREEIALDEAVDVSAGEEIGAFNLGSTVILLIENADFAFDESLVPGEPIRMGTRLGRAGSGK